METKAHHNKELKNKGNYNNKGNNNMTTAQCCLTNPGRTEMQYFEASMTSEFKHCKKKKKSSKR